MFLVRLHHFDPLMEATSILAQISHEADLKFSSSKFSLITSYPSLRFVATFQISHRFFANYFVDRNHSSRVSLQSFYNAMYAGIVFSSMTIHFPETTSRMVLQFESSNHTRMQMHRVLKLSPSQEEELGQIQHDRFFSIISQDFRDIVTGLPSFPNDSIFVSLTSSQVKFCCASEERILTKEGGRCVIVGYEGQAEIVFQINLNPKWFFFNLSYGAYRIWFYKTIDSRCVIFIPAFGLNAQYVIYFS
ncbi:uncharacterized protein LOC111807002 [Cucurbita pepo subsp. pepo]|uniref:uncharacterized protein LOC111807002 n=1 Tax=Cucurbita pepo subsp. pepo TaxID=3664 RepID=UPI000C9D7965|nr:uncharacterized protein LOC111807002 [Cucurbita pepo subsp. pepo]